MNNILTVVIFSIATQNIFCVTAESLQAKPYSAIQERIVGGSTAEEALAPYHVALQVNFSYYCGGAIIDTEWILTAAHCVVNLDPEDFTVLTGTQNIRDSSGVLYDVDSIYIHCKNNFPINDIALLHLKSNIILNEETQIIRLPRKPLRDGANVLLTGWGKEKLGGDNPSNLKKANLKFMSYRRCKRAFNFSEEIDVGNICTFTKPGEGSCFGDSGGPLVSKGYIVGVVSWGRPCALGYPDVYASTYYYLNWIKKVMNGNSRCIK